MSKQHRSRYCLFVGVVCVFATLCDRSSSATAGPSTRDAMARRPISIVRATRAQKLTKSAHDSGGVEIAPAVLPQHSPCVARAYAALAIRRDALLAHHGGPSAAFDSEYARLKKSLVSDAALEAAGCVP